MSYKEISDSTSTNPNIQNTPIWWELQNIPTELIRELRRRKANNNIGINYLNSNATTDSFGKPFDPDRPNYKGPLTPWVRVFSNSTGKPLSSMVSPSSYLGNLESDGYNGFILKGGDGFFDAFGYEQGYSLSNSKAIIGYQAGPGSKPHYLNAVRTQVNYSSGDIDEKFPQNNIVNSLLPPPGIISVNVKQSREMLTFSSFKFNCYTLAQLEYLTPFFLTAGINVFIEFGYNYFNRNSLIPYNNADGGINESLNLVLNPQTAIDKALESNGNYGCVTGIITKFNFSTKDGFLYECNTEITSRQGLFAGMRVDDQTSQTNNQPNGSAPDDKIFLNLKNSLKNYLPLLTEMLKMPEKEDQNFLNFIRKKQLENKTNGADSKKAESDSNAITEQSGGNSENEDGGNKKFYGGKPEDRIFTGRKSDFYKGLHPKSPILKPDEGKNSYFFYKKYKDNELVISYADKNDWDKEDNHDEVWLRLDFLIEILNLFMSDNNSTFKLNIENIIVNAHPNLISCDKNILIPNARAPKVNIGRPVGRPGQDGKGYLKGNDALVEHNKLLGQYPMDRINGKSLLAAFEKLNRRKKNPQDPANILTEEDGFYIASDKVRKIFKTIEAAREDLDMIINSHYYIKNTELPIGSQSFPWIEVPTDDLKRLNLDPSKYKKYYHGYLKNLFINKSLILKLVDDESLVSYKNFLGSILTSINESVDGFWKFDIVEHQNGGGLSIIDKNLNTKLDEIYMFEVGGTNSCIKNINFDVSLSNEQAVNVLFGGQENSVAAKYNDDIANTNQINELNFIKSKVDNTPIFKFNDRLDKELLKLSINNKSGSLSGTVPGTPEELYDDNSKIANIQTYGKKSEVLEMTVKLWNRSEKLIDEENGGSTDKLSTACLNLHPDMKGDLRAILTDGDIDNNASKYSGVADNFQITITFDGIFAFRNMQVFALSNLPKPYIPGIVIFQVLEAEHNIQNGNWETNVTALVRSIANINTKYVLV